jgi:hypothetical protein
VMGRSSCATVRYPARMVLRLSTLLLLALACGGAPGGAVRCYELVEGDVVTTLVLDGAGDNGTITVYERKAGVDVEPPQTTPGRLGEGSFTYADGTTLQFDAGALRWPEKSLLPGVVFKACASPP